MQSRRYEGECMCLSNSDLEGLTVNYNDVDALDEVLHRCGVATVEGVNVDVVVLTNNLDEALTADDGYGSLVGIADDVLNAGQHQGHHGRKAGLYRCL